MSFTPPRTEPRVAGVESCTPVALEADGRMVTRSLPLFRFDPGWLFVLAGLALVLAAAVLPSERQLHGLRMQLEELRHAERANFAVLGAYDRFISDFDERDPALVRRLAASQLNVIPRDDTPLLMASSVNASVPEWIESTVEVEPFSREPKPETLLGQWTEGRRRLWAIGAGAFFVFIGLMLGSSSEARVDSRERSPRGESVDGTEDLEGAEYLEGAEEAANDLATAS